MASSPRNDLSVVDTPKLSAPVRGRLEHQASRFVALVAKMGSRYRLLARSEGWRPEPEDMRVLEWCTRYLTSMLAEQRMRSQLTRGVEIMSEADFDRELDGIVRARVARMTDAELSAIRTSTTVQAPSVDLTTEPASIEESSPVSDLSTSLQTCTASEHAPAPSSDSSSPHSSGRPYLDDEYDE